MPLAALQMNKLFSKFTNLKSWRNRINLFLAVFFVLGSVTYTLVGAQVATKSFEDELKANKNSKGVFDYNSTRGLIGSLQVGIGGCQGCPEGARVGAIQGVGNMMAGLYHAQPVSGVAYVQSVMENMGLADKAYAQTSGTGTGYNALAPLLGIWKGFRNFAYGLFVVMFVFMGLAIMFRMKLNPQTVVSIQSALPRIVVALLLVTFSYPIAGFVIDLIYVSIGLIALMFGHVADANQLQTDYLNAGGFRMFREIMAALNFKALVATLIAGAAITAVPTFGISWLAFGIGGGLLVLVFLIITFYIFIRLFMDLLKAYIGIIMGVIFGPIQITLGIIPGIQGVGFGTWFRNLLANAAVFPAVAFVLMFARVIQESVSGWGLWDAPLLLGGGLMSAFTPTLIAFGTLIVAHQIPDTVKKAIAGSGFEFNTGRGWKEAGGELTEIGVKTGAGTLASKYNPAGTPATPGEHARRWAYNAAQFLRWTK